MKLLTVAALSAVLVVPCFSNAIVSSSSPDIPFPRQLGKKTSLTAASPDIPFPRQLGKKTSLTAYSPDIPFPRQLGKKS